ncbi:TBC1 domain family member 2B [Elysia marginata]|uniref:TBC1 domain family member 2B n=1 Tax=Elysia marginata TaxID=1093978 RepID=A0AAV4GZI8_9GAST|nr:TBC1 domain family member 2B [Elysia marginata]
MLYTNYRNRKLSIHVTEFSNRNIQRTFQAGDGVLTLFLICWQAVSAYWTLGVWKPHAEPPLHDPDNWCHQGLYMFAVIQLAISATVVLGRILFQFCLMICFSCTDLFESPEI